MLGYVNELRREVLGSGHDLVLDPTLISLSQIRAKEIIVNYSHSTDTYTNAGENITNGGNNIKSQFNAWKQSPGHYQNMINKDYEYFGYAPYHRDLNYGTGMYGVQLFWTQENKTYY